MNPLSVASEVIPLAIRPAGPPSMRPRRLVFHFGQARPFESTALPKLSFRIERTANRPASLARPRGFLSSEARPANFLSRLLESTRTLKGIREPPARPG